MEEMRERLKNVPLKPGVYIFKDQEGQVIYVGKAKLLRNRMRSYFQSPDSMLPKVKSMMAKVADFDYIVTGSEVEALILENNLIKAYQPRYNILLRDDKTYPYLKISQEKFPRIAIVREPKDKVSRYFGPYTEVGSVRETLKLLTGVFPLRTCKNLREQSRPCLNYDMGKCLAPCKGLISQDEYQVMVDGLIDFLEGKSHDLIPRKEEEMRKAAANLEFEKAARLRDQIQAIHVLQAKQQVMFENPYNLDAIVLISTERERESLVLVFKIRSGQIIAKDTFWLKRAIDESKEELLDFFIKRYYSENLDIPAEILINETPGELELLETWLRESSRWPVRIKTPARGEKKIILDMVRDNALLLWEEKMREDLKARKILEHLARTLEMEVVPERIEGFDISHLGGEETVASMAVFTNGAADKKAYRHFKIKNEQNNDFASLSETLERRFKEARRGNQAFLPEPDLILIDGGLGQVNAVKRILDQMGVDIHVLGLAKKNEEIFLPGRGEPLRLSRRDEGLMLLQRLRDEAHRFAISYNRQRRGKKIRRSVLDDIPGVGPARKKALLQHFGSVAGIKSASLEEIKAVPGMNAAVSKNVYDFFR
ncbi:UvrABC system, subunit C [Syntrophomonas zehnderi OL-4]|uniref:UvrABC system protein C n=1 Tax=Syntrophomonas zehnderi OL-4 TaxID=690567 RepID=A0A0E3WAR1_9FIRM|nr:excinuclease ABC subunit UvrC [Syntrophomonas zehnderi]CQB51985.1 UvrABC system, subunit C [Syntrophomonas zehnderi OL-4]